MHLLPGQVKAVQGAREAGYASSEVQEVLVHADTQTQVAAQFQLDLRGAPLRQVVHDDTASLPLASMERQCRGGRVPHSTMASGTQPLPAGNDFPLPPWTTSIHCHGWSRVHANGSAERAQGCMRAKRSKDQGSVRSVSHHAPAGGCLPMTGQDQVCGGLAHHGDAVEQQLTQKCAVGLGIQEPEVQPDAEASQHHVEETGYRGAMRGRGRTSSQTPDRKP